MDEQKTQQNIIPLLKDIDALAQALQIQDCSPELQLKVINQAQKTIAEMHAKGKDSAELIDALAEYIPDFEKSLEEEIARTLNEFSTAKSK